MIAHRRLSASYLASFPILFRQRAAMYLCYMIESERALALNVVVSTIFKRVVRTDQDLAPLIRAPTPSNRI